MIVPSDREFKYALGFSALRAALLALVIYTVGMIGGVSVFLILRGC